MFWVQFFAGVVGPRMAEKLLQAGDMPNSPELLEIGMVDEVVEGAEAVLPATLKEVRRWLKSPDLGRIDTKKELRGPLTERWAAGIGKEAGTVWAACSNPETVASLAKVLERLSGGGGTKKAPAATSKL
mmetsp:Transcript_174958/g.555507  ORF Transcript_174958/g.555507 Transcript_174958/m.555507 type:complete len:129 (+) Transcript_174958:65-451(+)